MALPPLALAADPRWIGVPVPSREGGPRAPAPTTEELVAQCQAGHRAAFALLVEQYQERVFNFLLQLTRQRQDAEDLTQVTFLKAYQGLHRYRGTGAFTTWLFTIAKRTAFSHLRAAWPHEVLSEANEPASLAEGPATVLAAAESRTSLWAAARRLSPAQFQALWLRYAEGFSVAEVATVMGTNHVRVRVLLHRGRRELARRLRAAETGGTRSPELA